MAMEARRSSWVLLGEDDIYEARRRRRETRGVLIMLCGRNTGKSNLARLVSIRGQIWRRRMASHAGARLAHSNAFSVLIWTAGARLGIFDTRRNPDNAEHNAMDDRVFIEA